jgi:hypothetical protein
MALDLLAPVTKKLLISVFICLKETVHLYDLLHCHIIQAFTYLLNHISLMICRSRDFYQKMVYCLYKLQASSMHENSYVQGT